MVIEKNTEIAKRQMKEGYTALHIAAANDHVEIASLLLTKVDNYHQRGMKSINLYCAISNHMTLLKHLTQTSIRVLKW